MRTRNYFYFKNRYGKNILEVLETKISGFKNSCTDNINIIMDSVKGRISELEDNVEQCMRITKNVGEIFTIWKTSEET